jgi:RimJ/RimL family protein N-acetyltransferase
VGSTSATAEPRPRRVPSSATLRGHLLTGSGYTGAAVQRLTPSVVRLQPRVAGTRAPARPGWIYEPKFDGCRVLLGKDGPLTQVRPRGGGLVQRALPEVVASVERIQARHVVLDGELVVVDESGHCDFDAACARLKSRHGPPVQVFVFDVLALEGEDLRARSLRERKRALAKVLGPGDQTLRPVHFIGGPPNSMIAAVDVGRGPVSRRTHPSLVKALSSGVRRRAGAWMGPGGGTASDRRGRQVGADWTEPFRMILRNVTDEDLPIFFEHQRDPEALRMAAFSSRERDAFLTHWRTNVLRPENVARSIVVGGLVAGYISSWEQDGKRLVAYWIGREHWGRGLATRALSEFLVLEPIRPLHAWVAVQNVGSIRVLEKCGFRTVAQENQQHADGVAEVLMRLGSP